MNITGEVIEVLRKEPNPRLRVDVLLSCLAIECAFNADVEPDGDEMLQVLRDAYLDKIKRIEELCTK